MMKFNIFSSDLDVIIGSNKFYTFREAAKIINCKGLGQNNLLKLLREKGVFNQYNEPLDDWKESGFFIVVDNRYATPLISAFGINYIQKHFM